MVLITYNELLCYYINQTFLSFLLLFLILSIIIKYLQMNQILLLIAHKEFICH